MTAPVRHRAVSIAPTRTRPATPRAAADVSATVARLAQLATAARAGAWDAGRDIALARNAHRTNTVAQMAAALSGPYDWFEGDVRMTGAGPVLAHDILEQRGGSLSLADWLRIGALSGRGLKLDFKSSNAVAPAVRALLESGVPQGKLIINVVASGRTQPGRTISIETLRQIRAALPGAMINLDPGNPPYDAHTLAAVIAAAKSIDGPIMFPLNLRALTPEVVRTLKPYGRIAVWHNPSRTPVRDVAATVARLRSWGVDGMIDLTESSTASRRRRT